MAELAREHAPRELARRAEQSIERTAQCLQQFVRGLPRRSVRFEDQLDPLTPGGEPVWIRVALRRTGSELEIDFRGSAAQLGQSLNATRAVTEACVAYVLQLLLPAGTPLNEGCRACVRLITPPASVVDAAYPAPVAAGNVEVSQRIVDVLLGAFAQWFDGRIPAASAGTMSNLSFGGSLLGRRFAYYETIAGGAGASARAAGAHAVHTHMTNTRNTPIEELERRLPVRVERCSVRRGSGGRGVHAGGDGIEKELRFLAPTELAWIADRTRSAPWGLRGGAPGDRGSAYLLRGRSTQRLDGRVVLALRAGERFVIHTPGGGGFGRATPRRKSIGS
jgi:N-methylhydantoinase B